MKFNLDSSARTEGAWLYLLCVDDTFEAVDRSAYEKAESDERVGMKVLPITTPEYEAEIDRARGPALTRKGKRGKELSLQEMREIVAKATARHLIVDTENLTVGDKDVRPGSPELIQVLAVFQDLTDCVLEFAKNAFNYERVAEAQAGK